jgi:hypothetical protein
VPWWAGLASLASLGVQTAIAGVAAACVAAAIGLAGLAGCAEDPNATKYCDVVKRIEASADPLGSAAIYQDPTALKTALDDRITTYDELAREAPSALKPSAEKLRDVNSQVRNAWAAVDFRSGALNDDPKVKGLLTDAGLASALAELQAYNVRHCGIPADDGTPTTAPATPRT